MKRNKINNIIGGLLTISVISIVIFVRPITAEIRYLIYFLTGLTIIFFFPKESKLASLEMRGVNINIRVLGSIAIIFILFFLNPIKYFHDKISRVTVTVQVHGASGKMNLPKLEGGYVSMDVGTDRRESPINEKGEAIFKDILPPEEVLLGIRYSEPYFPTRPDSVYTILDNQKIYLEVHLKGSELIKGTVLDDEGPLSGVTVRLDSLFGYSDTVGYFKLNVPEGMRSNKYEVLFAKKGYETVSSITTPQTNQPFKIFMKRKKDASK